MHQDAAGSLDLPALERFTDLALAALGEAREEIDALNVYPVPDGDTGTNMFLTFEAARSAMLDCVEKSARPDHGCALAAFARGALLGARGNSGVILSQLIGAFTRRLAGCDHAERPAEVVADGLALAAEAAYAAVGTPVEGTMLSVARAASRAAVETGKDADSDLRHVLRAAADAAHDALARTPQQLPTLRDAGVVDAGGRGLCVLLDAAETAVTGRRSLRGHAPLGTRTIPVPQPAAVLDAAGPTYEVMFLLDAEDDRIPDLRRGLAALGDSLVVVGGDGLWNVHVHVDDVGGAIEAGIAAGRPHRIRVTSLAERPAGRRAAGEAPRQGRNVVVLAASRGLADLFTGAGASVVPAGRAGSPSTGRVLDAITASGAAEVVLLPNDPDSFAVAEAAARMAEEDHRIRVAVVPTRTEVHGLAALAVHEPGRSFDDDVLHMTAAARHARSGAVTVAAKQAMTTAGHCRPGDVLGAVEGDFVLIGHDLFRVATGVLERLLGGGGELVTLVAGARAGDLARRCEAYVHAQHPTVDVVTYDGGQERYPLLVAVE